MKKINFAFIRAGEKEGIVRDSICIILRIKKAGKLLKDAENESEMC